jgi:hypothetical protein
MANSPLAYIPATEVRTIWSAAVGQEYLISVALHFRYGERPEKNYPVIYVLDSNLFFGMVVDMVRVMNVRVPFCNELPDAIIVGIGYPASGSLVESHAQIMHLRMRDFLPVSDEWAEKFIQENFPISKPLTGGGASLFLQFIHQEVLPLIENVYRTDATDRTLMGHSWGGLFALYTLFHHPNLFQRYVVVSPDLTYDGEQSYAEKHTNLPVRLYLACGESELDDHSRVSYESFISVLESRRYGDFKLTHQIIPNSTHCAVVAPAFQAGLVAVFN